jgi:hypothetical protein
MMPKTLDVRQTGQTRRLASFAVAFRIAATLATISIAVFGLTTSSVLADDISPEQVNQAIDDAVQFLKRQQLQNGSWEEKFYGGEGGVTALATLALLNAGVPPEDPAITRALSFLRPLPPEKTYAVSLKVMVFSIVGLERDKTGIANLVRWLEATQIKTGQAAGGWSYPPNSGGDNSNSQFAILALYEAERIGIQADARTWMLAKGYWERGQNRNGSWGYTVRDVGGERGSMTCAGIGALAIINGVVPSGDASVVGNNILCCQDSDELEEDPIERGLEWLADNFRISSNPGHANQWRLYYLYGLERVGRLTARRFIGEHDWYREGTEYLLTLRGPLQDHWEGLGSAEDNPIVATSFALLFLTKGRRPVLMAKIQYGDSGRWDAHSQDVDHLTRFVESKWEMDLTWQSVDIRQASAEELLQSPVLFIAGGDSPLPTEEAAQRELADKLRDYVDRGGFLFAEGYCGDKAFDTGFRALIGKAFPETEYKLEPLHPAHPVWRIEIPVEPDQLRPLEGIEFGCRTSVIYAPPALDGALRPSLSCTWEISRPPRGVTYAKSVQHRIDGALAIGVNVLAYATNRELKYKYDSDVYVPNAGPDQIFSRGSIYLANLEHAGGCRAAPGALANLLRTAASEIDLPMAIEQRRVAPLDNDLANYHLLYMHGRNSFRWLDTEREKMKTYVDRGGMLFVNAICANREFTGAFRQEMQEIFPESSLETIPPDDPIWSEDFGGFELDSVTVRIPQRRTETGPLETVERSGPPQLEGIQIDGRWAVIFSPYDISCALERQNSLECEGYDREDAAKIGLNVLLYSLEN